MLVWLCYKCGCVVIVVVKVCLDHERERENDNILGLLIKDSFCILCSALNPYYYYCDYFLISECLSYFTSLSVILHVIYLFFPISWCLPRHSK